MAFCLETKHLITSMVDSRRSKEIVEEKVASLIVIKKATISASLYSLRHLPLHLS
jgi:hypothetical protein